MANGRDNGSQSETNDQQESLLGLGTVRRVEVPAGEGEGQPQETDQAPQTREVGPLEWFHGKLVNDQRSGLLKGVPEDYRTFDHSFQDPGYREQLHTYLRVEQKKGNVRGIPADLGEFTKRYAPEYSFEGTAEGIAPGFKTTMDNVPERVARSAENATDNLSLMDQGLNQDQIDRIRSGQQIDKDTMKQLGDAGEYFRGYLEEVNREKGDFVENLFGGPQGITEEDNKYISELSQTQRQVKNKLFQVYSGLQSQLEQVRSEINGLYREDPLPDYAGEGMYRYLPEENVDQKEALEAQAEAIEEQIDRIQPAVTDRVKHSFNQFVGTYATEIPAGIMEGVAVWAKTLDDMIVAFGEKAPDGSIRKGIYKSLENDPVRTKEVEELASYEAAQKLRKWGRNAFPTDPTLQDSFFWTMLPAATASFGSFASGGLATRMLGGSAGAFATTAAATGGSSQGYAEAKAMGASEKDAMIAGRWGFIPGAIQVLPVLKIFERMDKASAGQLRGGMMAAIKEGGATSMQEAFVEAAGQGGFDIIARNIYDQEREYMDSVQQIGESAGAGAFAGFISGVFFGALGRGVSQPQLDRMRRERWESMREQGAEITPRGQEQTQTETDPDFEADTQGGEEMSISWDLDASPEAQVEEIQTQISSLEAVRDQQAEAGEDVSAFDRMIDSGRQAIDRITTEQMAPAEETTTTDPAEGVDVEPTVSEQVDAVAQENNQKRRNIRQSGTLGQAEGSTVQYGEYRGRLTRDNEGNFVVETRDGTLVEVADSRKNPDLEIAAVGIERSVAQLQRFRMDPADPSMFSVETQDPGSGELSSQRMQLEAVNTNNDGDPVSVTMIAPDGNERTFRDPVAVEQVVLQQFQQQVQDPISTLESSLEELDPIQSPVDIGDVEAPGPVRLDDGDARLEPVFQAFDNQTPLTEDQQTQALQWASEKMDEIVERSPENSEDLLNQLEQFEQEVIDYGATRTNQPDLEPGVTPEAEAPVSQPTTEETATTSEQASEAVTEVPPVESQPGFGPDAAIEVQDGRYQVYHDESGQPHVINNRTNKEVGVRSPAYKDAIAEFTARKWAGIPRQDIEAIARPEQLSDPEAPFGGLALAVSDHLLDVVESLQTRIDNGLHKESYSPAEAAVLEYFPGNSFSAETVRSFDPDLWQDRPQLRTKVGKKRSRLSAETGPYIMGPDEIATDVNARYGSDLSDGDVFRLWVDFHSGEVTSGDFTDATAIRLAEKAEGMTGVEYTRDFHDSLMRQVDAVQAEASAEAVDDAQALIDSDQYNVMSWFDEDGLLNVELAAEEIAALAEQDPDFADYQAGELSQEQIERLNYENQQPKIPGPQTPAATEPAVPSQTTGQTSSADEGPLAPAISYARQQMENDLQRAQEDYMAARTAYETKSRQLENTLADDSPDIFGERPVDRQEPRLFDERVDPSRLAPALQPFAERMNSAARRVNNIRGRLEQTDWTPDASLFENTDPATVEASQNNFEVLPAENTDSITRPDHDADYYVTRLGEDEFYIPIDELKQGETYSSRIDPETGDMILTQQNAVGPVHEVTAPRYTGFDSLESAIEVQRRTREIFEPASPQVQLLDMASDQLGWTFDQVTDTVPGAQAGTPFPADATVPLQEYRRQVREWLGDTELNGLVDDGMITDWYYDQMAANMIAAEGDPNTIGSLTEHSQMRETINVLDDRAAEEIPPGPDWPALPAHPAGAPAEMDPTFTEPSQTEGLEETYRRIQGELRELTDEFGRMSMESARAGIDPRMVAQAARIIAKGAQLGYVRFQQFAQYVIDNYGADYWRNIYDSFRTAYVAQMRREGNPNGEDLDAISQMSAEDFIGREPTPPAPTTQADLSEAETPAAADIQDLGEEGSGARVAALPNYYVKIPSIKGGRGYEAYMRMFEGAAELLERTPGLQHVGRAIRTYYDTQQRNHGEIYRRFGRVIEEATGQSVFGLRESWNQLRGQFKESAADKEFGRWAYAYDRLGPGQADQVYMELSPELQKLADAWIEIGNYTHMRMTEAEVQVYDAQEDQWRPIGKVEQFFPRVIKPEIEQVLRDPTKNPELHAELTERLIREGVIESPEGMERYIGDHFDRSTIASGDFFAGMEMARTKGFPADFYDHSISAAMEYLHHWADRMAQIEAFGQRHKEGDIFDRARKGKTDQDTVDYLTVLQKTIYNSHDPYKAVKFMATLNQLATAGMLANFGTATLNTIGGMTLNNIAYGRYALQAYAHLFDESLKLDAKLLGIINNDYIRLQHDASQNGITPEVLHNGVSVLMNIGGYSPTERLIRLHAFAAAGAKLNDAVDTWSRHGLDSRKGQKLAAWFERNGFNPNTLMQEVATGETTEGGRITGPEIDRFYRYGVNLTQGSYSLDQVPLWSDTQYGRFLFKYFKFGTQLSRMYDKNFMKPLVKSFTATGETYTLSDPKTGDTRTVKNPRATAVLDAFRFWGAMSLGGTAYSLLRGFVSGYQQPGPAWDELERALEDEETRRSIELGLRIAFESALSLGGMGILQYPHLWTRDFMDRRRAYDPTNPPGITILQETAALGTRIMDQGGNVDLSQEFLDYSERVFSLVREGRRVSMYGLAQVTEGFYQADLEVGRRERIYVRNLARRYAIENEIVGQRLMGGMFGATENTATNRDIFNGLIAGHPGRARAALERALEREPERADRILRSAKTSVHMRQPALIQAAPSNEERLQFLQWAHENLTEDGYKRVIRMDQRYRNGARQIGLMTEPDN